MKAGSELQECRLELKYCERCGALWVRRAGTDESYCERCAAYIEELPKPKPRRKRQRSLQRRTGTNLQAVAIEGIAAADAHEAGAVLESGRIW